MKRSFIYGLATFVAIASALNAQPGNDGGQTQPQTKAADDGAGAALETLTRGPVHEAFAEPVSLDATATTTVSKQPPAPIDEIPPEAKPSGDAEWLPGYWSWDDDRDDFIWVSGVWRIPPHGQRWVPGYWTQASDGWRRVSGFWTAADNAEVAYLPEPPETQEAGPTSDPPSADYFWVPGCWLYRDAGYAWRPGYWSRTYDNWLWVPHHYVWTPRGVIFVSGYWDAPLVGRGMLFAPVYFRRPIYRAAGYRYVPDVVVNVAGLHLHLFARPRYHHYFFGDYYADRYASAGFYPWYASRRWRGYDPIFQYAWAHEGRHRPDWLDRYQQRYRWYRENDRARPAHTFAQLREQIRSGDARVAADNRLAETLADATRDDRYAGRQLTRLAESRREQIARDVRQRFELVENRRSQLERGERVTLRPTDDGASGDRGNRARRRAVLELPDVRREPAARRDNDGRNRGSRPDERSRGGRRTGAEPPAARELPDVRRPSDVNDRPAVRPRRDRPDVDRPDRRVRPDQRSATPSRPNAAPDRPEARPKRPSEAPPARRSNRGERPSRGRPPQSRAAVPDHPEAAPNRPNRTSDRPDRSRERPDRPEPRSNRRNAKSGRPEGNRRRSQPDVDRQPAEHGPPAIKRPERPSARPERERRPTPTVKPKGPRGQPELERPRAERHQPKRP